MSQFYWSYVHSVHRQDVCFFLLPLQVTSNIAAEFQEFETAQIKTDGDQDTSIKSNKDKSTANEASIKSLNDGVVSGEKTLDGVLTKLGTWDASAAPVKISRPLQLEQGLDIIAGGVNVGTTFGLSVKSNVNIGNRLSAEAETSFASTLSTRGFAKFGSSISAYGSKLEVILA
jgi:hypothetical protein